MIKNVTRNPVEKGINDVDFGSAQGFSNITFESVRSLSKSLSPAESYQLSIDLKAAIHARTQIARAKWRVFHKKSAEEIVDGELLQLLRHPAPRWNSFRYLTDIISNWHMSGEIAISVLGRGDEISDNKSSPSSDIAGLYPLNPLRLFVQSPLTANDVSQIDTWLYLWPTSGLTTIYNNGNLIFAANYNPLNHLRGMAPIMAGVNEITAAYQAVKYNAKFFANGAIPSHLMVLPPGTTREEKEAYLNEFTASHSNYGGGSHKIMTVTASQTIDGQASPIQFIPIEQPFKDAEFLNLINLTTERVMRLYGVPPVESGDWQRTRFDSVDIQREVFFESALVPDMEMLTQVHQTQLVDRYFNVSSYQRQAGKPKLTKYMSERLDASREQSESELCVLLDPDSMPIASKIKQSKVDYAVKLQSAFKITPQEAAVEVGYEFDDNPANTEVWVKTNEAVFGPPEAEELKPEEKLLIEYPELTPDETPETPETQEQQKSYHQFFRAFRNLVLNKTGQGKMFTLVEADKLAYDICGTDDILKTEIRKDYAQLYKAFKDVCEIEARKELVKETLNNTNRRVRQLFGNLK